MGSARLVQGRRLRKKSRMWPKRKKKAQLVHFFVRVRRGEGRWGGRWKEAEAEEEKSRLRERDVERERHHEREREWARERGRERGRERPLRCRKRKKESGDNIESFIGVFRSLRSLFDTTRPFTGVDSIKRDSLV